MVQVPPFAAKKTALVHRGMDSTRRLKGVLCGIWRQDSLEHDLGRIGSSSYRCTAKLWWTYQRSSNIFTAQRFHSSALIRRLQSDGEMNDSSVL